MLFKKCSFTEWVCCKENCILYFLFHTLVFERLVYHAHGKPKLDQIWTVRHAWEFNSAWTLRIWSTLGFCLGDQKFRTSPNFPMVNFLQFFEQTSSLYWICSEMCLPSVVVVVVVVVPWCIDLCAVDSTAVMTDSVITDSCPSANTNNVPMPPSYNDTRPAGEFSRDSQTAAAAVTADGNSTSTVVKVNGYTGHTDGSDQVVVDSCRADSGYISTGNINESTIPDADSTKLCSSDLRTEGCGERNRENSTSSAALPLTNGHVDFWFHFTIFTILII